MSKKSTLKSHDFSEPTLVERSEGPDAYTIQILRLKDFDSSLEKMRKTGGLKQKRTEKVYALLGKLNLGAEAFRGLKTTKHGESRVKSCIKYDLGNGCRLITVQTKKTITFCYVGDHDDCEKWLDNHSGFVVTRNKEGFFEPAFVTQEALGVSRIHRGPVSNSEKLIKRMNAARINDLLANVPPMTVANIAEFGSLTLAEDVYPVCSNIVDPDVRVLVQDVLVLLLNGDVRGAEQRMDLEMGNAVEIDELKHAEVLTIQDGDQIRRIRVGSAEHEQWLERFARDATYYDWLLFMHPEQEAVVEEDFSGPSQLSGVSGSGKTCIAVRRAIRLAEEDSEARVLLVTLNRSLAGLIKHLVEHAVLDAHIKERIIVSSFFELCQEILNEFEPLNKRLYSDVTWKLGEHIDEVFREFYRCWHNNFDADVLLPVHQSLISQGIRAEAYIREEFDWIRSALPEGERNNYLNIERSGRKYRIQEHWRQHLIDGLRGWENKMRAVGVIDYLGLTTAVSRYLDQLTPRYNHILIDEAQDFGTTELTILRKLVCESPNDIFLCGDIAQHVLPKHRSLKSAGIVTTGRTKRIMLNYRNTRQILKAAYDILYDNLDDEMLDSSDLEILDPKYANRSSPEPVVLKADTFEEEFAFARRLISDHLQNRPEDRCCIALAGYSHREVELYASGLGLPSLDGVQDPHKNPIVLSDLEQTKGYEFNLMIIVNCREDVLPPHDAPKEEAFRYACKLYVAMTRARDELYISYHESASKWLIRSRDSLTFLDWKDVVAPAEEFMAKSPIQLSELEDGKNTKILDMDGIQFNYSRYAIGLSAVALQKIEYLVDGKGLLSGGRRKRWKTMRDVGNDLENHPDARNLFGSSVQREVRDALSSLFGDQEVGTPELGDHPSY